MKLNSYGCDAKQHNRVCVV